VISTAVTRKDGTVMVLSKEYTNSRDAIDLLLTDSIPRPENTLEYSGGKSPGYGYAIREEGTKNVKIGCSSNPLRRQATMQVGNSTVLIIEWTSNLVNDMYAEESRLHTVFKEYRKRGEWFVLVPGTLYD
jgi:hypothetical protein